MQLQLMSNIHQLQLQILTLNHAQVVKQCGKLAKAYFLMSESQKVDGTQKTPFMRD
jgi:hypothetical protein